MFAALYRGGFMKSGRICLIALMSAFLLVGGVSSAKDLKGKLGAGFNSQLSPRDVDALSGIYWINNELGIQGLVGFQFNDVVDEFDAGAKVHFKIKDEENLHVDAIGGVGIVHLNPDEGDSENAFWASIGLGIEYFFSGLPNLGFSTEVGFTLVDIDDNTTFGSSADTFVGAGIHYYFDLFVPSVKKTSGLEADE